MFVDERPYPPPVARQRTVLALAILDPRRFVARRRLVTELWEYTVPVSAGANLRNSVSSLRRWLTDAIGPGLDGTASPLTSVDEGWALRLPPGVLVETDVTEFDTWLATARGHLARSDHDGAIMALEQALQRYQGMPFQGIPVGPALAARAADLDLRWKAAVEDYTAVLLRRGAHEQAVHLLLDFLGQHPERERAWDRLMRAQYQMGDAVAALHTYQRARRLLVERFGIEPGAELANTHRAVLRRTLDTVF
ncbi:AfsR/SARP family transcriptional regulator [Dactylosporangium sp. NPDC000555]|uniref:AfsR/SARP family transcriptional regulator n=1 Tax=Dactylosporangium sp. NPDC000555 TaxID=3154260 RepID=UPI0033271550